VTPDAEGERVFQPSARLPRPTLPHPIAVLVGLTLLCLAIGGVAGLFAHPVPRGWYATLRLPPGPPPVWLFPSVWVPLSVTMAVAAWRVWRADRRPPRHRSLQLWGWQLVLGAVWAPMLFWLHRPQTATAVLVGLGAVLVLVLRDFRRVDGLSCVLMAPTSAWICYATWLTAGIAWLNPG
jgi:benzodiazapine receptor